LLDLRNGWQQVDIYNCSVLASGHSFQGPAIAEAPTTTVVVPQGATATVDRLGNLVLNYL
jgi:N-methylhydantoinase A